MEAMQYLTFNYYYRDSYMSVKNIPIADAISDGIKINSLYDKNAQSRG